MRKQNILRAFLFAVFFGIGTASLGGSILCDDLLRYYTNKQLLKRAAVSLNRLQSLNTDYDVLLQQLLKDPNLVERIGPATLGTERNDTETIYPKATAEQLAAARDVLTKEVGRQSAESEMADWLGRCSEPSRRTILFLAGAALILISFMCFGPVKRKS